ncbi:MAG: hypothetical protein QHJ73_13305, partial [Armatimonadota bacterium]|nr:hypothetical protein [Armatimonadota bacterium]
MSTRRFLHVAPLLAAAALLTGSGGALGRDRTQVMEYYRSELREVPVLIFCSGNPQGIGPKFLARKGAEYLSLSDYAARKADPVLFSKRRGGKEWFNVPTVFLIAR